MLAAISLAVTLMPKPQNLDLDGLARSACVAAIARYPKDNLKEADMAITVGRLDRAKGTMQAGSFNGDLAMYPASVVKIFFLVYLASCLEKGTITLTPEIERAARNMIVDSNNDATGHIVDVVTGATPGPELPADELKAWMDRRQAVNRWFRSRGYTGVNACQRTYNEGPYGRERQGLGPNYEHRNMLTTNACAKLMADIALDRFTGEKHSAWMKGFLRRQIPADSDKADAQSKGYTGRVLPKGTELMSKAGWTSEVRHDLAWIKTPTGDEIVIAVFTKRGTNAELMSWLAKTVLDGLGVQTVWKEAEG